MQRLRSACQILPVRAISKLVIKRTSDGRTFDYLFLPSQEEHIILIDLEDGAKVTGVGGRAYRTYSEKRHFEISTSR